MRAYGNNTEILIDREREAKSHALLAERDLAPPLLARFENGLLYKFIRGRPTKPEDLIQEPIWRGVARRLAEWHARLPVSAVKTKGTITNGMQQVPTNGADGINGIRDCHIHSRQPTPNLWSVMQKWVVALPDSTEAQQSQKAQLQAELEKTFSELDTTEGPGSAGFVLGHCDLLSGNVIILPTENGLKASSAQTVTFIDYEYATPCPAAFDIANHFAEWGGFDCNYNMLPTRPIRRGFLQEYLEAYRHHLPSHEKETFDFETVLDHLEEQVNKYRGIPGLYWGIWALIQAEISEIDFDYSSYAKTRLGEYWAWRDSESNGSKKLPLRERRWAQEE